MSYALRAGAHSAGELAGGVGSLTPISLPHLFKCSITAPTGRKMQPQTQFNLHRATMTGPGCLWLFQEKAGLLGLRSVFR